MSIDPFKSSGQIVLAFAVGIALAERVCAQSTPRGTTASQATLMEVEGRVLAFTSKSKAWNPAHVNEILGPGDGVRTREYSRATLLWSDQSTLRLGELSDIRLEPPAAARPQASPGLTLLTGILYFLHRDRPVEVRFNTRTASAAVRGTEFTLSVDDAGRTVVTVVDGEVELSNAQGRVTVGSGEQGVAEPARQPFKSPGLQIANVIQWCLYYPAILDPDELELNAQERDQLADSLSAYRAGDLLLALARYPEGRAAQSPREMVYRAAILLAVGQVEQAERLLRDLRPTGAETDRLERLSSALQALIHLVNLQAVPSPIGGKGGPILTTELMAESYRQQAGADLDRAEAAAREAVRKSPDFGFGWERLAELEFSFGHIAEASTALTRSLDLAPANAEAHSLRGYLLAAENKFALAAASFDHALALDGALGNAWLGRGLIAIRQGDLKGGRVDLLMAAAVEPQRALFRSYLGKAYAHEGDAQRAGKELDLAKGLDPRDPTAWLYSALIKQQQNRANEAIRDLEKAQNLTQNRGVYRSRLLLQQDRALQSANLANIYRDAGLFDVSLHEAARAVSADYGSYGAHLFLADSYNLVRDPKLINLRFETAAEAEYLLANLLAPVDAGPLSPAISQQEYSRLFQREGLGVVSSTTYLSRGAWIEHGAQFGTFDKFSYNLEAFYYTDPGERVNNDLEQQQLSMTLKGQATPQDTLFLQLTDTELSGGDLTQRFDPATANPTVRFTEKQEPIITLGYHHEWSPGVHTLLLGTRLDDRFSLTNSAHPSLIAFTPEGVLSGINSLTFQEDFRSHPEIYSTELQQIFEQPGRSTVVGTRFQYGHIETRNLQLNPSQSVFVFPPPPEPAAMQEVTALYRRLSFYGYQSWQILEPLQLIGGITYDRVTFPEVFRTVPLSEDETTLDQISPKAGLVWTPTPDTTVRAAYTRSLSGASLDQSQQIEPTQVAGFLQSFRSIIPESIAGANAGASFETYDLSLEQRFPTGTYVGVSGELLYSDLSRRVGAFAADFFADGYATPTSLGESLDFRERSLLVSVNQLVGANLSFGARYRLMEAKLHDRFDVGEGLVLSDFDPDQNSESLLHQLSLVGIFNHASGAFAQVEGLWTAQDNSESDPALPDADFWQLNAFLGYRFAHRRAELSIGLLNLTDQDYRLNPLTLYNELPHERTFLTRFVINF